MRIKKQLPQIALTLFNVALLLLCFYALDIPSNLIRNTLLGALSFSLILCVSAFFFNSQFLTGLQLSLTMPLSALIALDLLRFSPQLLPPGILNYLARENVREAQNQMVEYLDGSPYARFRPHTRIRSQGHRGVENEQFVYEWTTDRLGFKNNDSILDSRIEIVSVGDSFTEGMGVKIADTLSSQLTQSGHVTYSIGVQGYAVSQMQGAFARYGKQLNPKTVLIGYTGTIYSRESAFFEKQKVGFQRRLTGGIQSIAVPHEVKQQSAHVAFAMYLFLKNIKPLWVHERPTKKEPIEIWIREDPFLKKYETEILPSMKVVNAKFVESIEFKATLAALLELRNDSVAIGAKPILLYFPSRSSIYARHALKNFPSMSFEQVESRELRKFSHKHGISFLDMSDAFLKYLSQLESLRPDNAPYLEADSHPSRIGYTLMKDALLKNDFLTLKPSLSNN